jgi:hypothetical protein
MYGYSNRTTRKPFSPSPFAKKPKNGESIPAPAPWARATVLEVSVGPSNSRSGSAGTVSTSTPGQRTILDCTPDPGKLDRAAENDAGHNQEGAEQDHETIADGGILMIAFDV